MEGVVVQAVLGLSAVGNVGLRARHPHGAAVGVAHRQTPREHPAIGAVRVEDAAFDLQVRRFPGLMRLDLAARLGKVLRMNSREPFLWIVADLVFVEPEHRLPARGVIEPIAD